MRRGQHSTQSAVFSIATTKADIARTDSVAAIVAQRPSRPGFLRFPHRSRFRREFLRGRNCSAGSRLCFARLRRDGTHGEQHHHKKDREPTQGQVGLLMGWRVAARSRWKTPRPCRAMHRCHKVAALGTAPPPQSSTTVSRSGEERNPSPGRAVPVTGCPLLTGTVLPSAEAGGM